MINNEKETKRLFIEICENYNNNMDLVERLCRISINSVTHDIIKYDIYNAIADLFFESENYSDCMKYLNHIIKLNVNEKTECFYKLGKCCFSLVFL